MTISLLLIAFALAAMAFMVSGAASFFCAVGAFFAFMFAALEFYSIPEKKNTGPGSLSSSEAGNAEEVELGPEMRPWFTRTPEDSGVELANDGPQADRVEYCTDAADQLTKMASRGGKIKLEINE
jgi:hypothetical protein